MDIHKKRREVQLKEIKKFLDTVGGKIHTDDDVLNIIVNHFYFDFYEKMSEIGKLNEQNFEQIVKGIDDSYE